MNRYLDRLLDELTDILKELRSINSTPLIKHA
jgi:hypothetical protein